MKHFAPEYPFWSRRTAELFVLTVARNKSFSVSRAADDDWWISLPGKGLIDCASMEACETMAVNYILNEIGNEQDDDEPEDDRAYGDRRFQDARDRLGRTI
jgi:hypothetical protein